MHGFGQPDVNPYDANPAPGVSPLWQRAAATARPRVSVGGVGRPLCWVTHDPRPEQSAICGLPGGGLTYEQTIQPRVPNGATELAPVENAGALAFLNGAYDDDHRASLLRRYSNIDGRLQNPTSRFGRPKREHRSSLGLIKRTGLVR